MPQLEYINFRPMQDRHGDEGRVFWEPTPSSAWVDGLPQIFWRGGEAWAEANLWALEKLRIEDVKLETVKALMKHLHAYATFIEDIQVDWRHFPMRMADRALVRFRGHLIGKIAAGNLASTTARSRMSAVLQFYRFADAHGFIDAESPMWIEKSVMLQSFDAVGLKRTFSRTATNLSIPNRSRPGTRLEDGLLPLSEVHMRELLSYSEASETLELHLLLTVGFFTGARKGTITSLRIENLEQARPDPFMQGFFLIAVGPGTGVATKFDVQGNLLVPDFLLVTLKGYATSSKRLRREAKADASARSIVFLTSEGRPYSGPTIDQLMTGLRRRATKSGLKFVEQFKFHQTRATYGTWLMKLALEVTSASGAIEFVRAAMLHKNESTTLRYIKFLEVSKGKQQAAEAFNRVFTGLGARDWNLAVE